MTKMKKSTLLTLELFLMMTMVKGEVFNAKICSIVVNNTFLPYDIRRAGPAIDMALERVAQLYNHTIRFSFVYRDGGNVCGPAVVGTEAASVYQQEPPSVFIGPGCSLAVEPLSYMAARWNIPVITPAGSAGVLADKSLFPTLTRLSFGMQQYAQFYLHLLAMYGWSHVALFYDKDEVFSGIIGQTFYNIFRSTDLYLAHHPIRSRSFTDDDYRDVMQKANQEARVFIVLAGPNEIRKLLLQMHDLGYTSGEHVIIATVPVHLKFDIWQRNDEHDEKAKFAAQSALFVALSESFDLEYANFKSDIVTRALRDYNLDFGFSQPSILLTGFYDAIMIYAEVINETLAEGADPLNGSDVTRRMWNRTFSGIGGRVSINPNGDKYTDFILFDLQDTENGVFEVIGEYYGKQKSFEFRPGRSIHWPGGVPPADTPDCGFRGDRCIDAARNTQLITGLGGGLGVLAVGAIVTAVILFRKWRLQSRRDLWWWQVNAEELVQDNKRQGSTFSSMSKMTVSVGDDDVVAPDIALYKGLPVCMRKIQTSNVEITTDLLKEFKTMRDMNHANLVILYGACLDSLRNVLVIEFCPKGTLQDLLGNPQISLDAQFKFSLTTDVVQGMCYIHEHGVGCHGRLRSNNCFIDNRFSVKLSDFGLPSLHPRPSTDHNTQEDITNCLWLSPEVLRLDTIVATKEADVYSFGIVLQEIITREAPFYNETADITPKEIILKLIKGGNPPFRPHIEGADRMLELQDMTSLCLTEEPQQRPTFKAIRKDLKMLLLRFGDSGNLLDSLLRRMEQYANNLEKLVEEKTHELRDEKKKSEQLLYQILPRSVAERLKRGMRVEPEAFECVTVYFSDICGFTKISARSTPLQVVDLLNDLYTCFDAVIGAYDVYKVETIGDAYMVVSGLPVRNGNLHAREIARMSLSLLTAIDSFRMRHLPDEKLKLRIGLHSGSVCAGVVGQKMPRYCLFGDTVNTASRMESHGEGMRIHMSQPTQAILETFGTFRVERRGDIDIKGKGTMTTYWLLSSD